MPGTSSPAFTIWPFSSQMIRLQVSAISARLCATGNTAYLGPQLVDAVVALTLELGVAGGGPRPRAGCAWLLAGRSTQPGTHAGGVGLIGRLMKSPTTDSTIRGLASPWSLRSCPWPGSRGTTFRSPVRSSSSAAFTPRRPVPSVYTAPCRRAAAGDGAAVDTEPDDADRVAPVGHEGHAADRVHLADGRPPLAADHPQQGAGRGALVCAAAVHPVHHVQVVHHDHGPVSHGRTSPPRARRTGSRSRPSRPPSPRRRSTGWGCPADSGGSTR